VRVIGMSIKMKKSLSLITLILLQLTAVTVLFSSTYCERGRNIDLFTQKQPFSGRGPNQPSDSFQPQEEVILYALVTYNEAPIQNKLVAFQIEGPSPPMVGDPIRIILSSATNESGIASVSFRIPTPIVGEEGLVIGEWFAIATVDIAGVVVNDTLTFRVDYGVKITSVATLNFRLSPQTTFLRGESVVFSITAENTGLTSKNAFFTVDVVDASATSIIHVEFEQTLTPGQNILQTYACQIPTSSRTGDAVVYVNAFTAPPVQGGAPYGPGYSTTFQIVTRDVAISSISLSGNVVKAGETVKIGICVRNKGNYTESFPVKVFYNQTFLMEKYVGSLLPLKETCLDFLWNTTGVPEGNYMITGLAGPVEGEIDVEDNVLKVGPLTVLPPLPQIVHDVAITSLKAQPLQVQAGQPVNITLCVKNLGTEPENFNVTIYYDRFPLATLKVGFLAPGANATLSYIWDTSNVLEGNYTIKAVVPPLAGEVNVANNQLVDGKVWVRAPQIPVKKHDVAVTSLSVSRNQVFKGEDLTVYVNVANLGDYDEVFRLSVYANMSTVWSCLVDLKAGGSRLLSFTWRVNLDVGRYVVWARAENVSGEVNVENNVFVDGTLFVSSPPVYYLHDVAVTSIHPSSRIVYVGQKLNITVTVMNLGNATESFNLTLFYDSNVVGKISVHDLMPGAERSLTFEWDTFGVAEGNYTIKAYADPVMGEANLANNLLVDGKVAVLKPPPTVTHDVAVLWLGADKSEVNVGDVLTLKVVVANLGNVYERFNLTVSYDSRTISTFPVGALAPFETREIIIHWNTSGVKPGSYILSAAIPPVEGETNTADNVLVDGKVTLKPIFAVSLFILILPIIVGIAVFLVILLLLYFLRRRRKAAKPPASQFVLLGKLRV
jgi:hypothetical protein